MKDVHELIQNACKNIFSEDNKTADTAVQKVLELEEEELEAHVEQCQDCSKSFEQVRENGRVLLDRLLTKYK